MTEDDDDMPEEPPWFPDPAGPCDCGNPKGREGHQHAGNCSWVQWNAGRLGYDRMDEDW